MILVCPACNARYQIAQPINPPGRRVRCGRCSNVWWAEPDALHERPEAHDHAIEFSPPNERTLVVRAEAGRPSPQETPPPKWPIEPPRPPQQKYWTDHTPDRDMPAGPEPRHESHNDFVEAWRRGAEQQAQSGPVTSRAPEPRPQLPPAAPDWPFESPHAPRERDVQPPHGPAHVNGHGHEALPGAHSDIAYANPSIPQRPGYPPALGLPDRGTASGRRALPPPTPAPPPDLAESDYEQEDDAIAPSPGTLAGRIASIAVIVAALAMLAFAILGRHTITQAMPGAARIYAAVGLASAASELVVRNIRTEWQEGANGQTLIVRGEVHNPARGEQAVPSIQISLRDGAGNTVLQVFARSGSPTVSRGGMTRFTAQIPAPPADSVTLAARLGAAQ